MGDRTSTLKTLPMTKLTQSYVEVRGKLDEHKKNATKIEEQYEAVLRELGDAMLAKMTDEGVTSAPNEYGTPYIYPYVTGNIVDFELLWKWMIAKDRPDVLQKRLTLSTVTAWNEENPAKPVPGVSVSTINQVRVTAPKRKS